MNCFHTQVIILCTAAVLAVSVAQLSPSGDVEVCLDAVVDITCNISRSTAILTWEVTPPGRLGTLQRSFLTNNLPDLGVPVPHSSGINLTIHNVTDTSIESALTVDTSDFDITDAPIVVRCLGADGEAAIRNFGVPAIEELSCIYHETWDNDFSQLSLFWSLSDSSAAPVDNYILTFTPSPPSLTPSLIIITTTTTTATLTLPSDVTYSVQITADSCVGSTTTNYSITTSLCNDFIDTTTERVTTIFLLLLLRV